MMNRFMKKIKNGTSSKYRSDMRKIRKNTYKLKDSWLIKSWNLGLE